MSHAFIYPNSGLATVYDGDKLWVFDLADGGPNPELVPDFHEKTRTLVLGQPEKMRNIGAHPYPAVYEVLKLRYMRAMTLLLILTSIDGERAEKDRKESADMAVTLLTEEVAVRNWIIQTFQEVSLPGEVDLEGIPNEELKNFLKPFCPRTAT